MGHCLQKLLLIYHLLCYHGNTFIEKRLKKVRQKLDFDPKDKEWRNYSGPVMTSFMLLWFWIEFVTYFHTTKVCFNSPSNSGNEGGGEGVVGITYLVEFSDSMPGSRFKTLAALVRPCGVAKTSKAGEL